MAVFWRFSLCFILNSDIAVQELRHICKHNNIYSLVSNITLMFVSEEMTIVLDSQNASDINAFKSSETCSWLDLHIDKLYSYSPDIPQVSTQRNTLCWVCSFPNIWNHYKQVLLPKAAVLHSSTVGWRFLSLCAAFFLNFLIHLWWFNWNNFPHIKLTQQKKKKKGFGGRKGAREGLGGWKAAFFGVSLAYIGSKY